MTISAKVSGKAVSIPVSTNAVFRDHWLPGAKALDLAYVPRFYYWDIIVTADVLPDLMQELSRLKEWMRNQEPAADYALVIERVERLERELPQMVAEHGRVVIG